MEKNRQLDENEETEENRAKQSNPLIIQVQNSLNQLLESIEIKKTEEILKVSIYKIPNFIRETNPAAFEPKVVSLGPYHHGKQHLLPMELEKLKVFHRFKTYNRLDVESIVERASSILEDLLRSYDNVEEEWIQNPDKFLQLMIVDGCFMVEFFNNCPTLINKMSVDIKRDMMRLENQLPLKLLYELYSLANQNTKKRPEDLTWLICRSLNISGDHKLMMEHCSHILYMYTFSLLYLTLDIDHDCFFNCKSGHKIRPITRLHEAGIKLKRSKIDSLANVLFNPNQGVLTLPRLIVDNDTELKLSNVMAFETLHMEAGSKVTSFIILMHNLINEDRDVALLEFENIVLNLLGTDQDAVKLFSRLGSGAVMDLDSHMVAVYKMVNEHCSRPWNMWCAKWKHYYFQNPWTLISFYATVLGFLLLIAQFTYQLLDYYLKL